MHSSLGFFFECLHFLSVCSSLLVKSYQLVVHFIFMTFSFFLKSCANFPEFVHPQCYIVHCSEET